MLLSLLLGLGMLALMFKATGFAFTLCGKLIGFIIGGMSFLLLGIIAVGVLGIALFIVPVIILVGMIAVIKGLMVS